MTTETPHVLAEETQVIDSPNVTVQDQHTVLVLDEQHDLEEVDYKNWTKEALLKAFQEIGLNANLSQAIKQANRLKVFIEEKIHEERLHALEKFLSEGGTEEDFMFKGDSQLTEVEKEFKNLKTKHKNFLNDLNRKKQENHTARIALLDKLRHLVEGEKGISFKQIQEEWKKASPIPHEYNEELWASFNALADRYYDNRTIDFELKELDKKKNLEIKLDLCAKAEALLQEPSVNKSLDTLNFLHREYKHTGPIPDEQKEVVWQRFKTASDALYVRRDEHLKQRHAEQALHLEKKREFLPKLEELSQFISDSTEAWKQKIAELESLQKDWSNIGFAGKDDASKEVNKKYWELIKAFYKHKSEHYKKVYHELSENLKKKEELCAKAEALNAEENLDKAGKAVIELQKAWKEIGHVPFKLRDKIYERFKKACDEVFNRKRGQEKVKDQEYEKNLEEKLAIADKITALDPNAKESLPEFKRLLSEWKGLGFVPRKDIADVQARYSEVVKKFLDGSKQNEEEKRKIKLSLEIDDIRAKPDAKNLLYKKESGIKGKIKALQAEIDTLNNNLMFFSKSKNASSLAKEVENKVQQIEKQILSLKDELKFIQA